MGVTRVLTIAGSDSGGGAGIQADLKTITVLGGFGMSVITALTAQNTLGVQGVYEVPEDFVEKQFDSVATDIGIDAAKTGMLANPKIIKVVAKKLLQYGISKVVVDPVMVAKGGTPLISDEAKKSLKEELLPLALIITPNIPEAEELAKINISSIDDMKKAAKIICGLGAKTVVIKGGHLAGDPVDILYDGENFLEFTSERINTKNTHGTGCTFSAAIAAKLAEGKSVFEAVKTAKEFTTAAIRFSLNMGGGHGPTNHIAHVLQESERYNCIQKLKAALQRLHAEKCGNIIPEVQSNLGYALPYACKAEDIAAIPGRIIRIGEETRTFGDPEFGASHHIADIILSTMKYNVDYRCAMNIRFNDKIIEICRSLDFDVDNFDRSGEPDETKSKDGYSLKWGVDSVLSKKKSIPDIIFDRGDLGKEPMIRVIGKKPADVVDKVLIISKKLKAL